MDNLASDLSCALEDSNSSRRGLRNSSSGGPCSWKHSLQSNPRKSRSTSNLLSSQQQDSDDSSKGGNESDDLAERSLARLSLHSSGTPTTSKSASRSNRFLRQKTNRFQQNVVVESDSFNEFFGPNNPQKPQKTSQTKRRRRYKRMAVDAGDVFSRDESPSGGDHLNPLSSNNSSGLPPDGKKDEHEERLVASCSYAAAAAYVTATANTNAFPVSDLCSPSSSSTLVHGFRSAHNKHHKKISGLKSLKSNHRIPCYRPGCCVLETDLGKRKRSHRSDKNSTSNSAPGGPDPIIIGDKSPGVPLDNNNDPTTPVPVGYGDAEMKSEEDDDGSSTSTSSCYYSDHKEDDEDEGQEGDDEHSDWVSEDWMEDMESERRRDMLIRKLRNYSSREMRAGKRRVHPNKPVFSIKTSANEKLSKFLQDPQQSQLRLHPMRKEERVQLGHLASLYSLKMHYIDRERDFICPILTKTSNTTRMDGLKSFDSSTEEPTAFLPPIPSPPKFPPQNESKRLKK